MEYSEIMVRYGKLSTKRKNRMRFINKLKRNMPTVPSIYPEVHVKADRDRAHVSSSWNGLSTSRRIPQTNFWAQNFLRLIKLRSLFCFDGSPVQTIMKEIS